MLAKLDSYAEISPSGDGLKVFIKDNKPGKRCRKAYHEGGIEIYDLGRFSTVTGRRLQEYPSEVNFRHESLDLVYTSVFGGVEPETASRSRVDPSPQADDCTEVALNDDDEINELTSRKPRTGD